MLCQVKYQSEIKFVLGENTVLNHPECSSYAQEIYKKVKRNIYV
jgi:hypothetical protein